MKQIFLPVIVLLTMVSLASAQSPARKITVSGTSTIKMQPDVALVRFSVVSHADDPETARALNADASKNALNTARGLGILDQKMKLEQLRLNPRRVYNQQTRRYEEQGFEVSRFLAITLDDLDQLPTLIARLVQGGVNRLSDISYDLQDRDAAEEQALVRATQNARRKAELMASTLQTRIGNVLEINEQNVSYPIPAPVRMNRDMMVAQSDANPEPQAYAAGELDVSATVIVTFELVD